MFDGKNKFLINSTKTPLKLQYQQEIIKFLYEIWFSSCVFFIERIVEMRIMILCIVEILFDIIYRKNIFIAVKIEKKEEGRR